MINFGFENEKNIYDSLNNHYYCFLSPYLKSVVKKIFPHIRFFDKLHSEKCYVNAKPDIMVELNGDKKYVSIKTSKSSAVHQEQLKTFLDFLREIGVSERTIKIYLLFHYGDGTTDGSGKIRYEFDEVVKRLSKHIKEANNELSNPEIISKFTERVLFEGNGISDLQVDFLLHGTEKHGIIVSRKEAHDYIVSKCKCSHYITIHIGPFVLAPYLRDPQRKSKKEYKRDYVIVKWPYMQNDIDYIFDHANRKSDTF